MHMSFLAVIVETMKLHALTEVVLLVIAVSFVVAVEALVRISANFVSLVLVIAARTVSFPARVMSFCMD